MRTQELGVLCGDGLHGGEDERTTRNEWEESDMVITRRLRGLIMRGDN